MEWLCARAKSMAWSRLMRVVFCASALAAISKRNVAATATTGKHRERIRVKSAYASARQGKTDIEFDIFRPHLKVQRLQLLVRDDLPGEAIVNRERSRKTIKLDALERLHV